MKPSKFSKKSSDSLISGCRNITMMVCAALLLLAQAAHASVNVRDFGAVGDGVTDDSAAIQSAIDASGGDDVVVSAGNYRIGHAINISSGITIRGISQESTVLLPDSNIGSVISINTNSAVHLSNFGVIYTSPQSGGAVISVTGPVQNRFSEFSHILIKGGAFIGMSFVNASWWRIDSCFFWQCSWGVSIQNQRHPDEGDSTIANSSFIGQFGGTGTGVIQSSSGGLRISNCKFMHGCYGYYMCLATGVSTSDLVITGCSMEAFDRAAIFLYNAGAGAFYNVMVSACEFGQAVQGSSGVLASSSTGVPWIGQMTISGCTFVVAPVGFGVDLGGVEGAQVSGNSFRGPPNSWAVVFRPWSICCDENDNSYSGLIPVSDQQSFKP
jgi:polygalacturonase